MACPRMLLRYISVCPQAKKSKSERGGIEKAATDVDTKAFANSKNFFKAMQAEADR